MEKTMYLEKLKLSIREAGHGEYYVDKCVRYAQRLLDNNLPVIFDTKHLALLIGIPVIDLTKLVFCQDLFYTKRMVPKKTGGFRELEIPTNDLKYIQRWLLQNVLYKMHVSSYTFGFEPEKSIVDNAKNHVGKYCIVNIDVRDFFPSITFDNVFRLFAYYGYTKEMSFIMARLCTYEGKLPQGSPASPRISNICSLKLDARLSALSKAYNAVYSRYADDITFSGNGDIKSIVRPASQIIMDEGFGVNEKKTRVSYPFQRQEVTGLLVNGDHVRIPRKYKREVYQELYYCKKYGVEGHLRKIECTKAFYKEHIYGKIYYVNMVEPDEAKKMFAIADQIDWSY